jgi:hypothetical protein
MTEPAYSCRISLLKCFSRSAAHAKAFIDGGKNDETLSLRLGTGGHALTFGTPEVVCYRGGTLKKEKRRKGKKGQPDTVEIVAKEYSDVRNGEFWDLFKVEHAGKVILNETEYAKASAMANALHSDPYAAPLLFAPGTQHEILVTWMLGGRRCTGRLDALGPEAVVDLKCVADASPRAFRYASEKYGFGAQAIWYADGCELAGLGERKPYLIAVESSPPHLVQVYELNADDIATGRRQYNAWMDRLLECEESNYWPGYVDGVAALNVRNMPPPDPEVEEADGYESGDGLAA